MSYNSFDDYPMSWRPELVRGAQPLYIELAQKLQSDIECGILSPGTKLPPQRELADFLNINLSTVSRAFKLCSEKGLLTGTVGSGTFVTYDVLTNLIKDPEKNKNLIEMGSMTPETIPQDEIADLMQELMREPDSAKYFQYLHEIPDWQLDAAAGLLRKAGCRTKAKNILISGGGQNALAAVFASLFRPGDRLGVDPLVYPGVKSLAKLFGIQLVPVSQENGEMSEAGIRYAVKNEGVRVLYVVPDFQNPTCHTMSGESRRKIAALAEELGLLIIEDGITGLLSSSADSIFSHAPENTVYILSLSKTISPALRIAYIAAGEKYYSQLENALYNINLSQSALTLELASRLIVSGLAEKLLARRSAGIIERNKIADEVLSGQTLLGEGLCLSRWLILPDTITGAEFERAAFEKGVSVYAAERFVVGRDCPAAARIAICSPDSIHELKTGLMILKSIIE